MKEKRSVVEFLIITFVLSSICYAVWIRGGQAAGGMSALLMWCPAVAAFVVRMRYYRHEKLLGWNPCRWSFILAGILIPLVYLALSYGIFWLLTPGSFTGDFSHFTALTANFSGKSGVTLIGVLITLLILILSSLVTATGEEIGWRGFLLPQMTKFWNIKTAILVSGLIWAVWHMPIMLAGLYLPGTPLWFKLPMFTAEVVAITVVLAVLRLQSGSVWPAILLHAFHNFFDQLIFQPLTSSPSSPYFTGETGIITLLLTILAAWASVRLFWKHNVKPDPANEVPTISSFRLGDD